MTLEGWAQFESTGRIDDYLAYIRQAQAKCEAGTACRQEVKVRAAENMKESEEAHGADHCTYRYGAIRDAHRGL